MGNCNECQARRDTRSAEAPQVAAESDATAVFRIEDADEDAAKATRNAAVAMAKSIVKAEAIYAAKLSPRALGPAVAAAKAAIEAKHAAYLRELEDARLAAIRQAQQPPPNWDDEPTGSMLIELDAKNPAHAAELQTVTQQFNATYNPSMTVTCVRRVQNLVLHRAYEAKKAELIAANPGHPIDVLAWHGTKGAPPELIAKNGFDPSKGVMKPGHIWFGTTKNYAANGSAHKTASGEQQILSVKLCPLPSESQSGDMFAVGSADRMLPEYVITFTKTPLPLPAHWDADPTGSMLIELDAKNPTHAAELQAVTQRFNATSSVVFCNRQAEFFVVTRVHRIQNPAVYRAYQKKRSQVLAINPGHSVDILAWHGTKRNPPQSIVKSGFDTNKGLVQPKSLWFSLFSGYSATGFGHPLLFSTQRQIFSVKLAPLASERRVKAGVYIVGDSARMLPEHLITFKVASLPIPVPLPAAAILAQPLPSHWDADPTGSMLIELDANNPNHAIELQKVTKCFNATLPSGSSPTVTVTRVDRIQNPAVYRAYQARKAQLIGANSSHLADVDAWHNTKKTSPQLIVKGGFNPSKGVVKAGFLWFSKLTRFSAHLSVHKTASGELQIILVKLCLLPSEATSSNMLAVSEAARMLPTHLITFV